MVCSVADGCVADLCARAGVAISVGVIPSVEVRVSKGLAAVRSAIAAISVSAVPVAVEAPVLSFGRWSDERQSPSEQSDGGSAGDECLVELGNGSEPLGYVSVILRPTGWCQYLVLLGIYR